jgi:GNAT superfamily N-acetyltransferase
VAEREHNEVADIAAAIRGINGISGSGRSVGINFRTARLADADAIETLMKLSARALSRGFYDAAQIPSVERFIATLDRTLIEDGTYFVGVAAAAASPAGFDSAADGPAAAFDPAAAAPAVAVPASGAAPPARDDGSGVIACCGGWSRRDKLFTGVGERAGGVRLLDPAHEPARVRAMFVHPDFARRGLGRAILDLCTAAARAEGFQRLELMATLPGEPLYAAYGFRVIERVMLQLPDGIEVGGARMEKALAAAPLSVPRG